MTQPTLAEWLADAPFSVAMSAGFFGFFAHAGFVAALEERGLAPRWVTGASAGALIGGLWAAGLDGLQLRDELWRLRREHFWDPGFGAGLLRGIKFRAHLDGVLGAATFDGCRYHLALSAYDLWSRSTRALASGLLAPAIQASCTLPGLFQPVWHEGRPLLDGGILDRPGLQGMPSSERVLYHHLVSRSPWRWSAPIWPRRQHMTVLRLEQLPRVGPFRLEHGRQAFDAAWRKTRQALDQRVHDVVSV